MHATCFGRCGSAAVICRATPVGPLFLCFECAARVERSPAFLHGIVERCDAYRAIVAAARLLELPAMDLYQALQEAGDWGQLDGGVPDDQDALRRWARNADALLGLPSGALESALNHAAGVCQ